MKSSNILPCFSFYLYDYFVPLLRLPGPFWDTIKLGARRKIPEVTQISSLWIFTKGLLKAFLHA